MKKLENKIALVTSATRGIGLACAKRLAEDGARVYLAVRRVEETQAVCEGCRAEGLRMAPVYFDATEPESYEPAVEAAVSEAGRLDILVNNFGIGRPAEDLDVLGGSEQAFFDILRLNAGSVYRLSKLAIPHLIRSGGGSIVNISSIGGRIPDVARVGYGVSKAAVNHLTKLIALQYARQGIRCNAVLPGLIATDAALKNMPQKFRDSFLAHVPLNRVGRPEDVAGAVAFLAGEDSAYVTGQILDVAGGYGLGSPQYAEWAAGKA